MNKKQRRECYVQRFVDSHCTSIMDYYVKLSDSKVAIEQNIKSQMLEHNGKRYCILGGNPFHFTCAYVYPKDDTWILVVEAAHNHLQYDLTDEDVHLVRL